jgi:hypothetical protein
MSTKDHLDTGHMLIEAIQLLLEEKQTSLSVMRTGIFILLAQLVVICVLIATSQFYKALQVVHMIVPFYILNIALLFLAGYLIVHSLLRIRHHDSLILRLKKKHGWLAELMD